MLTLKADKRDGKVSSKTLRKEGQIPAVFYGRTTKSTPIAINARDFAKVWRDAGESTIINIETTEGKIDTLIHDVQFDSVTDTVTHADFYVIEAGKEVEVGVPLEFVGMAPAVKELGGILVKVMHELEIAAMPKDLPHEITVDVSGLANLDSQLLVEDILLPPGVRALAEADEVVAAISVAKEEEETPTEIDMSAIEVEKKGKKEEEEAPQE